MHVFRDGQIFETFEGSEIEPNALLEGMFGHSKKNIKLTSNENKSHDSGVVDKPLNNSKITPPKPANIQVVDFKNLNKSKEKIKIKYF